MPYVACYCEQVIGLSALPLPNGLALVSEPRLEEALSRAAELLERHAGNTEEQQRGLWDLFYFGNPALQRAVQCPNCGRLLVLNENEGIVMSFVPELGVEVADEGRSSRGFFAD